jgi:hypothetical protein
MEDPEQLRGVTDTDDRDHGLRRYIQHIERSEAFRLNCPYVQAYESVNIDGIDCVTGKSTLPLHAKFFPSPILSTLPDASKLPPGTPSSDLRLLSNGSTARTSRRERAQTEGQSPATWTSTKRFKNSQALLPAGIEYACPFHKSNPDGPHPKKCERSSWKTISKLKHVSKLS